MWTVVARKFRFSAAHWLPGHPRCGSMHGHNYELEIAVIGPVDPQTGMVVDFSELKRLYQELIEPMCDHRCLNDSFPVPTAECMVARFAGLLVEHVEHFWPVRLKSLRLYETPDCYAEVSWATLPPEATFELDEEAAAIIQGALP